MSGDSNIEVPLSWQNRLTQLREKPTLCIVGYDFQADYSMPHFTDVICGVWSKSDSVLNPFTSETSCQAVMNWINWRKKIICQFEHPERIQKFAQNQSLIQLRELQQLLKFDIVDQTPSGFLAANQLSGIYEVYGNVKRAKCHECGKHYESWHYDASIKRVINCEDCGGMIFPDISMFGWNTQVDVEAKLAKRLDEVENLLCIGINPNLHPFVEFNSTIQQKHLVEIMPKRIVFDKGVQVIPIKEIAKILGYREADYIALEKTQSTLAEGLSFFYWLNIALSGGDLGVFKK